MHTLKQPSPVVYLAGGINGLSDALARSWRDYVKTRLPNTLDPMRRDFRGREALHVADIVNDDIADIVRCDLVLAMCEVPSWGTAMELRIAHNKARPVYAVIGLNAPAISPWLAYHATHLFATVGQAVDAIEVRS